MSRSRILGPVLVLAAIFSLALSGCGVPVDGQVHSFSPDQIPYGLAESSTTSTSLSASSELPPEAVGGVSAGRTEPVTLYFVADGLLVGQQRELGRPVAPIDLTTQLGEGPRLVDQPPGVRSVVRVEHIKTISVRAGVGTVDLAPTFIELAPAERRLAVAQLVLTLTARPGIGQVIFSSDSQPLDVPRGDGSLLKGAVSRDDYVRLLQ